MTPATATLLPSGAMLVSEFDFDLPPELIAQRPPARRGDSRLLHLQRDRGVLADRRFSELPELLNAGDLLVFNDTRVLRARLLGRKGSGGRVELLVERIQDNGTLLAQLRASKPPRPGMDIHLDGGVKLEVVSGRDGFWELRPVPATDLARLLERDGHVPLPPYIRRPDSTLDADRYQTVYAREPGAVAAPTAGLHFTGELLQRLEHAGIGLAWLTLHVGAGTFQPLRSGAVEQNRLHRERYRVEAALCEHIARTRGCGGRVIAVGTTTVRALEAAALDGELRPCRGETDIFIYPGFRFRMVDALITNFHLPRSSLLLLVAALAGRDAVLNAYRHAIREHYRFFSYGDAMLIT